MKKAALTLLMLATFSYLYCANTKDMSKIKDLSIQKLGTLKQEHSNCTHGDAKQGKTTKEYNARASLINRCCNQNNIYYRNYGGRGIKVCDRWLESYENFLADMGRAPSKKHSLDRIDNNGNYEPNNCRWATKIEQCNNMRKTKFINYKGNSVPVGLFCREHNLSTKLIRVRVFNYGWSVERAMNEPKREHRKSSKT